MEQVDIILNRKATENRWNTNIQLGTLIIQKYLNGRLQEIKIIKTLENLKYKFPDGKYKLKHEYSPKFKGKLWELYGIDGRGEIKIHMGSRATHSKGCILVSKKDLQKIEQILDSKKTYYIHTKTN